MLVTIIVSSQIYASKRSWLRAEFATLKKMNILKKFGRLEVVAFISGFCLMAFELVGARMLSPTIGSSTYVWTSVIGVIIAALSVGYFIGGKLADARGHLGDIAFLCLATALSIGAMLFFFDTVMTGVVGVEGDARLKGVLASLTLFAPTSLLLGILSPYLVKLKVTSLAVSGQSVAGLSAFNSIGGIAGTFVTGFIVFSYLGSREALLIIVLLMVAASWLIAPLYRWQFRAGMTLFTICLVGLPLLIKQPVVRIDTPTANYQIRTGTLKDDTRLVRYLTSGPGGAQSGIYVNEPNTLPFWYTKEIVRTVDALPDKKDILVLGGGAFTIPEYLGRTYPSSTIDVVEIDPKLQDIAVDYFDYTPLPNVAIISDDARSYVHSSKKQYDIVIVDVYSDTSIPFSLLTREYAAELNAITAPEGVVIINAITARAGSCLQILETLDATYRPYAPYATLAQAQNTKKGQRANTILTYTRNPFELAGTQSLQSLNGRLYSDNFMPAERLQQMCNAI